MYGQKHFFDVGTARHNHTMQKLEKLFSLGFICIVFLFTVCAFTLVAFAGIELWTAVNPTDPLSLSKRFNSVSKCVAKLTIAMASLELAHTIVEDELKGDDKMSAPARIRRVLSRFLVVVIVSLAIECLVATFQYVHDDPSMLIQAASIAFGAAALLVAWGVFLYLTKPAVPE